jgi:hypothetical protein
MGLYYDEGRFWFRSAAGQQLPVPDTAARELHALVELFQARFGRLPGLGDPLLFDPAQDVPAPLSMKEVTAGTDALLNDLGSHPAFLHAYSKLGYVVTNQNAPFTDPQDLAAWDLAVAEWAALHPETPLPSTRIIDTLEDEPGTSPGSGEDARSALRARPSRSAPPATTARATTGWTAVQEALAHTERHLERGQLVIAILGSRPGQPAITIWYTPTLVALCEKHGQGAALEGQRFLSEAAPSAFSQFLSEGWYPIGLVCRSPARRYLVSPIRTGIVAAQPDLAAATERVLPEIVHFMQDLEEGSPEA